jgi:hypothetical protein
VWDQLHASAACGKAFFFDVSRLGAREKALAVDPIRVAKHMENGIANSKVGILGVGLVLLPRFRDFEHTPWEARKHFHDGLNVIGPLYLQEKVTFLKVLILFDVE